MAAGLIWSLGYTHLHLSPADIAWGGGRECAAAGVAVYLHRRIGDGSRAFRVDGFGVTLYLAGIASALLVPAMRAASGISTEAAALNLLYPCAEAAMGSIVLAAGTMSGGLRRGGDRRGRAAHDSHHARRARPRRRPPARAHRRPHRGGDVARRGCEVLAEIAALGVAISIDDFGTGHSSLAQLHRIGAHELKIDRAFTAGMLTDRYDREVVVAVVGLGQRLGIRVVAEGVEDQQTFRALAALGCHVAQGFGIARPMDPVALDGLLRAGRGSGWAMGSPLLAA